MELFKNTIDLSFFKNYTYKEIIKLRNTRVKRYEEERKKEEERREKEAEAQRGGKLMRR